MATIPTPSQNRADNAQIRRFNQTAERLKLDDEEKLEYARRLLATYESDELAASSPSVKNPHLHLITAETAVLRQCIASKNFEPLNSIAPR